MKKNWHVYICGPERYMQSVLQTVEQQGFPEDARHLEYFSVPEVPDYQSFLFTLRLKKSAREIYVPVDGSAADVLNDHGFAIDIKCSDSLYGVCQCDLGGGEVEHRDFVWSKKQRDNTIILCQSRAAKENGFVEIDL